MNGVSSTTTHFSHMSHLRSSHPTIPQRCTTTRAENYKTPKSLKTEEETHFEMKVNWLIDWVYLRPCRIDWLFFPNLAYRDTNVVTVHRLIDWLIDPVRAWDSRLVRLKRCERTVLCDAVWTNGRARKGGFCLFHAKHPQNMTHVRLPRTIFDRKLC